MIRVKGVSKTYNPHTRKANVVLDKANLELPDHGFVFIVGKSGIGKSTILNAIGGLISYKGEIDYGEPGFNVEKYRRANISYIFQEFYLFDDKTVRENIKLSLNIAGVYDEKEISRRVKMLLEATGLKINPKRRAGSLSLGQRQRVAIARALASDPRLILADEPTGNLDSKNGENIMKILKGLSKSRLVLCVTHNLSIVAKYADYAYTLKDKKFEQLEPSTLQGDADEGTDSIIDTSGRTIAAGPISIRLFGEAHEKNEILLVEDNGKLFLSGESITLVSKDEMEWLLKRKEDAKKEAFDAYDPSAALRFEKTGDNAVLGSLRNFILAPKSKSKVGTKVLRLVESLIPLGGAILATVLMMVVEQSFGDLPTDKYAESTVMLIPDPEFAKPIAGRVGLSDAQMYQIVSDPESGILDAPINPQYSNFYAATVLDAGSSIAEPFPISDVLGTKSGGVRLADISIYQKIPSIGLTGYALQDNEILLDVLTLQKAQDKKVYGDKPLASILKNSHLRVNVDEAGSSFRDYIVKGVVDTGLPMIYGNAHTVASLRGANQAAFGNGIVGDFMSSYCYKKLGDLSKVEFVHYEDIRENPDYEIVYPAKLPSYANQKAWCVFSTTADLFFPDKSFVNYHARDAYVAKKSDPSAMVVCFRDYNNSSFREVRSQDAFFSSVSTIFLSTNSTSTLPIGAPSLSFHREVDQFRRTIRYYDALVPSAFLNLFSNPQTALGQLTLASQANLLHEHYANFVGTYESEDPFAPVIVPEEFYHLSNSYDSFSTAFEAKMSKTYLEESAYRATRAGNRFLASDVKKAKAYFDAHVEEYGFRAESSVEIRKAILWNAFLTDYSPFLTAFYAMLAVLLFTFILDGFSNVNSRKAEIGTYRCLGRSRVSILGEEAVALFTRGLLWTALPLTVLFGILSLFRLYYLEWWGWLLIPGFMGLALLFGLLPLAWLLRKKPMNIMHTLQ